MEESNGKPTPQPVSYAAPPGQKTSPYRPANPNNFDPRKHGLVIQPNATLDRRLEGGSSMGTTVLVELSDFVKDLLPTPSEGQPELDTKTVDDVKDALSKLFYASAETKTAVNLKEDDIAEAFVNVLNPFILSHKYKAALSRYKANRSDDSKSKVDAAIYPEDRLPKGDWPDWIHCRFYIEFKRGSSRFDPWDDREGKIAESEAQSRVDVRAQLITYARQVFLYQHRIALYSLFIIGDSFRAMRWDRSGVIVSKKVNYARNPEPLLALISRLLLLDETQQGLDPTATLIKPGTMAFRLMDELAQPDEQLDMDYMEPGTEDYTPPPARPPPPPKTSSDKHSAPSASDVPNMPQHAGSSSPPAETTRRRKAKKPATPGPEEAAQPPLDAAVTECEPGVPDSDPDLENIEKVDGDPRVFRYVREKFRASLAPGWPRYKVKVGKEERVYLVAKPVFQSSSMFGRATRGYVAIDARTRRFVFLKDSWRPFYEGVEPEGVHLERFKGDAKIIVPTVLYHGDVGKQCAYTAQYEEIVKRKIRDEARREANDTASVSTEQPGRGRKRPHAPADETGGNSKGPLPSGDPTGSGVEGTLRHHIHYRIAVKEVCLPFEEFRTTYQLLHLMSDCVKTHYYVYTRHGLLHRDISAGNVLILPRLEWVESTKSVKLRWRGVLTDWELANPYSEDRSTEKARQPERTGTWQFMAVAYVDSQWTLPIAVVDELESFFHVTLFYAVRFLRHNILNVTQFVTDYFDTFLIEDEDKRLCSHLKNSTVSNGEVVLSQQRTLGFVENDPMNDWITDVLTGLQCRYAVLKHKRKLAELSNKSANSSGTKEGLFLRDSEGEQEWRRQIPKPRNARTNDGIPAPTAEQEATAQSLDHPWMLSLFADAMDMPNEKFAKLDTWVVKDQLINYEPRIVLMNKVVLPRGTGSRGTTDGPVKRARTGESMFSTPASSNQLPDSGFSFVSSGSQPHPSG